MRNLILAIALLLPLPLIAQTRNSEIGVTIGYANMGDFGDAGTFGILANHYFRTNLSAEFRLVGYGAELTAVDIGPGGDPEAEGGDFEMGVLSGSLLYHWLRGSRFSPYVGAGVAFVNTELVDTPFGDFEADQKITGLLSGGVNFGLTERWVLNGDVSFLPHTADFGDVAQIEADPLTVSAAIKFRW